LKNKSVILGLLIIITVCLLTGCGFKSAMNGEKFKNHLGAVGYTITDTEAAKYESDSYLVASKADVTYKVEYYEFNEEVEAKKVYKKYKDSIVDYITTDSKNTETTGINFAKTIAVSEEEYIVISRVKNTIIFIAGTNDYANEIDKLLEDIKY